MNNDVNNDSWTNAGANNNDDWGVPSQAPPPNNVADGWEQPNNKGEWTNGTPMPQVGGMMSDWLDAGRVPKVTITPPSADGARMFLSPRQHSHFMDLLNDRKISSQGHDHANTRSPKSFRGHGEEQQRDGGKKIKRKRRNHSPQWPMVDPIEEEPEDEMDEEEPGDNWYSDAGTHLNSPAYSMPSKTFTIANEGKPRFVGRPGHDNIKIDASFVESNGAALLPASAAFYSRDRLARNRIHWQFSPFKDERVSSLLEWVQEMAYGLATFGASVHHEWSLTCSLLGG